MVADVGTQLRRCPFQRNPDRIHDRGHAFRQRFANLAVVDGEGLRHSLDQIPSLYFHRQRLIQRIGRTNLNFDGYGRTVNKAELLEGHQELLDRFEAKAQKLKAQHWRWSIVLLLP